MDDVWDCRAWDGVLRTPLVNATLAHGIRILVTPRHDAVAQGMMAEKLRMATGRVQIGWSLRAPKTETRNRNPNPKPIRVEIHHQNQTRGYPKPEWIPETRG